MNLPKLQFKDADGHAFPKWEIYSLESICDGDSPITYGVLKPGEYFEDGVRLIQIKDLVDGKIKLENLHRISNDLDKEYKRSRIKTHDILISLIGTIGRIAIVSNQLGLANIHRNIGRIRTKYYKFVFHYLNSSFAAKEIEFISSGSSQSALNLSALREIKIPIPAPAEQTKIANFLTAIDEKISQLTQKYDLLKQYKKGVMQQIFSQKLRFKDEDGREFPEWDEKSGNEVFDSVTDKDHNSDLPILAISQEHGAIPREMIDYNISVTDKSIETYKVVQIGDFIISLRSFQGGIEYSAYKGICSPAYVILRPWIEINRIFFRFYLKTENYIKELNRNIEGIRDGKMISYKYFSEILLPFPSLAEQTKIANFLTAIDDKITHTQTQLDAVKRYKKGLLQQLFV